MLSHTLSCLSLTNKPIRTYFTGDEESESLRSYVTWPSSQRQQVAMLQFKYISFNSFFFKVFIEFVIILLLFYVLVFWPQGMWDLSSPTRDPTRSPRTRRRSLNHQTAREVPISSSSKSSQVGEEQRPKGQEAEKEMEVGKKKSGDQKSKRRNRIIYGMEAKGRQYFKKNLTLLPTGQE